MKSLRFIAALLIVSLSVGALQGQTNNKQNKANSSKTQEKKPTKKTAKDTNSTQKTHKYPDNTWEK
jgi:hypothetical protein